MPTGTAPTTSEWSAIILPPKVHLTIEVWQYSIIYNMICLWIFDHSHYTRYSVFKIKSETCQTKAQFCQNLYMVKNESLPDRPKFCRSGSAVRHLFWRLDTNTASRCWPTNMMMSRALVQDSWTSSLLMHYDNGLARADDKLVSELMSSFVMHICISRPQWVNSMDQC